MDSFLASKGVTREQLNNRLLADHRNAIAVEIGRHWETLATFIGVPPQEVHDIIEVYPPENPNVSPSDRRLALMRRWEELYGSEATYLRLIWRLEQIGRRDLSELLITLAQTVVAEPAHPQQDLTHFLTHSNWIRKAACHNVGILFAVVGIVVAIVVISTTLGKEITKYVYGDYYLVPESYESTYKGNCTQTLSESSHDLIQSSVNAKHNSTWCNSGDIPESDLPVLLGPFVGREHDLSEVTKKAQNVYIVNVNGAPGFGKSFLGMHLGYKIIKNGTPVRYVNIEDKIVHFQTPTQNEQKLDSGFNRDDYDFRHEPVWLKTTTALTKAMRFMITVPISSESDRTPLFEDLLKWTKILNCTTFLILDNCDDILSSSARNNFFRQVNSLIESSRHNLHIILVSQEKLILLDWFDSWTVKELNEDASIELLETLAPGIGYNQAKIVADLVGRCPLALKVVGHLLHRYGDQLTEKLEEELKQSPIDVLDEASAKKQQFRVIMNIVFNRVEELKKCGYAMSLFPGSFSSQAGTAILSGSSKRCLDLLIKHSLLDEYLHGYHHRYKMHRLIRKYFLEKVGNKDKIEFQHNFCLYYEKILFHFATNSTIIDESEWYMLTLEEHNIFVYLQYVLSKEGELSVSQLVILGFSISQKWISSSALQKHSKLFMENLNDVCDHLEPVTCGELYSSIVPQLYQECRCQSLKDYIQRIFYRPCLQVFSCRAAYKLNHTESIWVQLSEPEKSFVKRLLQYNCYKTVEIVFNLTVWSAFTLSVISFILPNVRKSYFLLISLFIALFEGFFPLFMNESEKMVLIEIILRKVFCQVLPSVAFVAVLLSVGHCLAHNMDDTIEMQSNVMYQLCTMIFSMTVLLSLFVSLYFFFPDSIYTDYTVWCPFLPVCY